MPTCRGTRPDGQPCGQLPTRGSEYCWQHDPEHAPQAPSCAVCRAPRLAEIEAAIAGGAPAPEVAVRFRVREASVRYHRARHMPPAGAEGAGGSTAGTDGGHR
jgi:hypothetical protein